MPPCCQGVDNGKKFPVIYLVVLFCGIKGLGEVSARVVCFIFVSLEKDSASGYEGGISGKGKMPRGVRVLGDGFREEALF